MVSISEIVKYCDDLLDVSQFNDYAPNGLQVEGKKQVKSLVCGVTASRSLIERAIEQRADAILVHHGYFWKGEDPAITGVKAHRIHLLMQHGINLLAYHLPLDAHLEYGNNVQLAKVLGLILDQVSGQGAARSLLFKGHLAKPVLASAFAERIGSILQRSPIHIGNPNQWIERIAWCTGAAQSFIEQAAALGVDAYLSGEISEPTMHLALENDIHYFAAGHHATERYGVLALGDHLARKFALEYRFFDIDNPA